MSETILENTIRDAFERGDEETVRVLARAMRPADLADFLHFLEAEEAKRVLWLVDGDHRAEVFGYVEPGTQVALSRVLGRRQLAALFEDMSPDERADLFNRLDSEQRLELLPGLAHAEREDLRRLASYAEGTAGAIMTSDYATLAPNLTAAEAIEALRLSAPDKETIYQAYVVDADRRLVGTLSLRDLILAPPTRPIAKLLVGEVLTGRVDEPQEEIAKRIGRYDLLALPILDERERLVGIVTYDDAMDVVEEEATEDFHKSATVGKLPEGPKAASLRTLYSKRVPWLVLLVFVNLLSGAGIAVFEDTIARYVVLVFFLPLLIASGGNAGAQAATLMVRALATGEVVARDWLMLLGREVLVAAALGLTMALAVSGVGWARGGVTVALVVATTMVAVVLFGSLIGMSLPFLLSRFKMDPATASGPLVTSLADVSGVLIYFSMATWLLDMSSPAIE